MAEYYNPLDRFFYGDIPDIPERRLSEPIIPTSQIGPTIPEKNPATGGHIIQNVQSAIRAGASTGQLVFSVPSTQQMGGRAKAYGKEVREALKEVMRANEFNLVGAEMPTSSMSNLSGYDMQRGSFSEQKLHADMTEVRDAMKFVADIAGGGAVDIWSQEAPRTIFDQPWAKEGGEQFFRAHEQEEREGMKIIVDQRTGERINVLPMSARQRVPKWKHRTVTIEGEEYIQFLDEDNNPVEFIEHAGRKIPSTRVAEVDPETGIVALDEGKTINDYKEMKIVDHKGNPVENVNPEEFFWWDMAQAQINQAEGMARRSEDELRRLRMQAKAQEEQLELFKKGEYDRVVDPQLKQARFLEEEERQKIVERVERDILQQEEGLRGYAQAAAGSHQQAEELKERVRNSVSATDYGRDRSMQSYAELGVYAMQESENNPQVTNPLHVGPENGWPQAWGGHPDEFIELVEGSRKKMVEMLTKAYIPKVDAKTGETRMVQNEHFNPNLNEDQAWEEAKEHIKGTFDTGHMGMWLDNFRHKPGESAKERLEAFNEWYMDHVQKIIDKDVVGVIQVVDSATGAHGHLPPGQGIFPTVDAVKKFKEAGYDGSIVSEGHEEEQFTHNRILTKAWEEFGSPITTGYGAGAPSVGPVYGRPWSAIQGAYFGRTYTPFFIVGAYSPSNEWKLWTEVPFE